MTLELNGQPILLQLAVWAGLAIFLVCFAVAGYVNFQVLNRIGLSTKRPEDHGIGWSERAGRRNSRFNRFFIDDEFRSLRRLAAWAWSGGFASIGWLLLLMLLFGERSAVH